MMKKKNYHCDRELAGDRRRIPRATKSGWYSRVEGSVYERARGGNRSRAQRGLELESNVGKLCVRYNGRQILEAKLRYIEKLPFSIKNKNKTAKKKLQKKNKIH